MPSELNFEQIVLAHQAMVFRALLRLLGPATQIEDLAQEVFLRLHRALPNFRGEAALSTYLYRITLNVAQTEWKHLRRDDRRNVSLSSPLPSQNDPSFTWEDCLEHPDPNPAEQLEDAEFALIVEENLHRLSNLERSILVLYHQEARSYQQIAHLLALPIDTVRTHLHRGRNKLRDLITASIKQRPSTQTLSSFRVTKAANR